MIYKKGDIVLLPFPFSDLSGIKKRPAFLISDKNIQNDFIALFITSNLSKFNGINIDDNDLKNGKLPKKSLLLIDKVFTINETVIIKKFATVENDFLNKAIEKICSNIGK